MELREGRNLLRHLSSLFYPGLSTADLLSLHTNFMREENSAGGTMTTQHSISLLLLLFVQKNFVLLKPSLLSHIINCFYIFLFVSTKMTEMILINWTSLRAFISYSSGKADLTKYFKIMVQDALLVLAPVV